YAMDLVIASGNELLLVHGRDRKLTLPAGDQATVYPAEMSERAFPFTVRAVATGEFTGDGSTDIALLAADGSVEVLARPGIPKADDLVMLDHSDRQMLVIAPRSIDARPDASDAKLTALTNSVASFDVDGAPVAMLPMRLDSDALTDLVVLRGDTVAPAIALTAPPKSSTRVEPIRPEALLFSNPKQITILDSSSIPTRTEPT